VRDIRICFAIMVVAHLRAVMLKHNVFVLILIQVPIAHKSCAVIVRLHVTTVVNVLMGSHVLVRPVLEGLIVVDVSRHYHLSNVWDCFVLLNFLVPCDSGFCYNGGQCIVDEISGGMKCVCPGNYTLSDCSGGMTNLFLNFNCMFFR
jgi:hypothetical protein